MELTKNEKVKLDNYKAHYNSILGNVNAINETLELKHKEINDIEKNLVDLRVSVAELSKTKEDFENYRETTTRELERKEANLAERDTKLKNGYELFQGWRVEVEKETGEILTEAELIYNDLLSKIKVNNQILLALGEDEDAISKTISLKEDSLKKLNKEKQETENDIAKNLGHLSSETERLNREILKREKDLAKLKLGISKEQEKVGLADKSILDREKKLKIKEHDLHVLTTRIRKKHKELFPEREFNI